MITNTYSVSTTQAAASNTASTASMSITGTNAITFDFSGIDQSQSTIDKIIVDFNKNDVVREFNRTLTDGVSSLNVLSFTETIESDPVDLCTRDVEFYLHREDGFSETQTLSITVYNPSLSDYSDVKLAHVDFFDADNGDQSGDTVMLTWEADDPGIVGNSFFNVTTDNYFGTDSTATSSCTASVGFEDEYDIVNAFKSHHVFNVERQGCDDADFSVLFKTRTPTANTVFGSRAFVPAQPNTHFGHVSGSLDFESNDPQRVKTINVPVVDSYGVDLANLTSVYVGNVTAGVGTSIMPVSGSYFYLDLFSVSGCETVTTTTSTVTAYIAY